MVVVGSVSLQYISCVLCAVVSVRVYVALGVHVNVAIYFLRAFANECTRAFAHPCTTEHKGLTYGAQARTQTRIVERTPAQRIDGRYTKYTNTHAYIRPRLSRSVCQCRGTDFEISEPAFVS